MNLWETENRIYEEGYEILCGVDEAGRGPLAGPVYAAAVILPKDIDIPGLNDSKKLSESRREVLFDLITQKALAFGIAFADVEEIESYNILGATYLAMNRAVKKLTISPSLALVDGNRSEGLDFNCRTIIKGDSLCADIAAASILAKVSRDRIMKELAQIYPEYGFEKHKGYGTAAHYAALREYGPCAVHRPSFLRKMH